MGRSQSRRVVARAVALATLTLVTTGAPIGPAFAAKDSSGKLELSKAKNNQLECDGDNRFAGDSKSSAVITLNGGKNGKVTAEVTINDAAKNADYEVGIIQVAPKSSCATTDKK